MRTITFNELRRIKDSLPSGSMHRIADELNMTVETVRNFFGGHNFKNGKSVGIHLEPGGCLPFGAGRLPDIYGCSSQEETVPAQGSPPCAVH